jgi:hypothetical protein
LSAAVRFLASDLAADVTGHVIGVRGPKLFIYRMEVSDGVDKDPKKGLWTPQEIKEAWAKIGA